MISHRHLPTRLASRSVKADANRALHAAELDLMARLGIDAVPSVPTLSRGKARTQARQLYRVLTALERFSL